MSGLKKKVTEYISYDSINIKVQNEQYLELQVWYN